MTTPLRMISDHDAEFLVGTLGVSATEDLIAVIDRLIAARLEARDEPDRMDEYRQRQDEHKRRMEADSWPQYE